MEVLDFNKCELTFDFNDKYDLSTACFNSRRIQYGNYLLGAEQSTIMVNIAASSPNIKRELDNDVIASASKLKYYINKLNRAVINKYFYCVLTGNQPAKYDKETTVFRYLLFDTLAKYFMHRAIFNDNTLYLNFNYDVIKRIFNNVVTARSGMDYDTVNIVVDNNKLCLKNIVNTQKIYSAIGSWESRVLLGGELDVLKSLVDFNKLVVTIKQDGYLLDKNIDVVFNSLLTAIDGVLIYADRLIHYNNYDMQISNKLIFRRIDACTHINDLKKSIVVIPEINDNNAMECFNSIHFEKQSGYKIGSSAVKCDSFDGLRYFPCDITRYIGNNAIIIKNDVYIL